MSHLDAILPMLPSLTEVERDRLRAALVVGTTGAADPAFPSIVKTPGVVGGSARLIRTRIAVWMLEEMRRLGFTEERMLESYPTLERADLAQAFAYAERHREEIDEEIRGNEEA